MSQLIKPRIVQWELMQCERVVVDAPIWKMI
jgi:hypothetical protein